MRISIVHVTRNLVLTLSTLRIALQIGEDGLQGQLVSDGAQADDGALGQVRKVGVVAKGLPLVHVGEVHLDKGDGHSGKGVAQGDAGVGKGGRIDDDPVDALLPRLMYPLDELELGIALHVFQTMARLLRPGMQARDYGGQGIGTIVAGFPSPEQVQVGAVEYQNACHCVLAEVGFPRDDRARLMPQPRPAIPNHENRKVVAIVPEPALFVQIVTVRGTFGREPDDIWVIW